MKQSLFRYILVIGLAAGLMPEALKAQDFHYSQYYAAPQTLNPALTGQFNGQYRVNLNYRSQWASIADPYRTGHVSFDMPLGERWAIGAAVLDQNAANGAYNTLNAVLSAAYDLPVGVDKYNHLVFGLQAGIINRSIDMGKLQFGDQYAFNGSSLPTTEVFDKTSRFLPEVNAGVLFYDGNPFKRFNYFVGATAFHLPEFNQSFSSNGNSPLYRRYLGHAGVRIKATRVLEVTPQIMGMYQNGSQEIIPGASIQYHLTEADVFLMAGVSYRLDDAVVPYAGLQFREYTLGLSYDVNSSDLDAASNSRGGFEISFSYIKKPKVAKPKFICPRI